MQQFDASTYTVDEQSFLGQMNNIRANAIEKILRMGNHDEDAFVIAQFFLQPDARVQIQMIRRFI